ncbi:hypothetical protein BDV12DRAFT_179740 [Aspergillus spectabilis]
MIRSKGLTLLKLQPPDYEYWLKNTTVRLIKGFLRWYLVESYSRGKGSHSELVG